MQRKWQKELMKKASSRPFIVEGPVDGPWGEVGCNIIDDAVTHAAFDIETYGPTRAAIWLSRLQEVQGWRRPAAQDMILRIERELSLQLLELSLPQRQFPEAQQRTEEEDFEPQPGCSPETERVPVFQKRRASQD